MRLANGFQKTRPARRLERLADCVEGGVSPAMAAGVTDRLWDIEDVVKVIDEAAPNPARAVPTESARRSRMDKSNVLLYLIAKGPGRTEYELGMAIYGEGFDAQQRVNPECRHLAETGRVERRGGGVPGNPYRYFISN